MTGPAGYATTWRDLYHHLAATGGTMTVRGIPAKLDRDAIEWVASVEGLNRYRGDECTATWYPDPGDELLTPAPVPAARRMPELEDLTPPTEVYQVVAADQARRWAYAETLDVDELGEFIRQRALDPGLRADVDAVWRYAAHHYASQGEGVGVMPRPATSP